MNVRCQGENEVSKIYWWDIEKIGKIETEDLHPFICYLSFLSCGSLIPTNFLLYQILLFISYLQRTHLIHCMIFEFFFLMKNILKNPLAIKKNGLITVGTFTWMVIFVMATSNKLFDFRLISHPRYCQKKIHVNYFFKERKRIINNYYSQIVT